MTLPTRNEHPQTSEPGCGRVARLIEAEQDVRRVLKVAAQGQRYRYLIETPFQTWPRFVIGTTDADLADVRIEYRCGAEWSALEEWECSTPNKQRQARRANDAGGAASAMND